MTHWVYVVELDPAVAKDRKFRKQNPDCDRAERFFYVGETAKDPETRFGIHKAGGKHSSAMVRKWGLHLRKRMSRRCVDRNEGRRLERETAERLRRKGHAAYFN